MAINPINIKAQTKKKTLEQVGEAVTVLGGVTSIAKNVNSIANPTPTPTSPNSVLDADPDPMKRRYNLGNYNLGFGGKK